MRPAKRLWLRPVLYIGLALLPLLFIPISPLEPEFLWTARDSSIGLAAFAAIFAVLAYSVAILLRFLDLASGAYAGLFAVGAYGSGIAMEKLQLGFWGALLLVIVVLGVIGMAAGAVSLRSTGIAFMIVTLAVGELLVLTIASWDDFTGGPLGFFSTQTIEVLPGVPLATPLSVYLVALVFLAAAIAITALISGSSYGQRLRAIRDNESLARSLGLNTFAYKLSAFVVAAMVAGAAGHLYFIHLLAITPDLFRLIGLISIFLMVIMGGANNLAGPAVGAWLVTFLPEWLAPLGLEDPTRQEFVFGGLLMLFMLLAPVGIMGLASRAVDRTVPPWTPSGRLHRLSRRARVPATFRWKALIDRSGATRTSSTQGPETGALLQVEGLIRSFHALRAVDDVSFEVKRGEVLGIIGPNGSGKTTLLGCVSGFLRPDSGRVIWEGRDVSGMRPDRLARLGLLRTFQERMSIGDMTAREHCDLVWEAGPALPSSDAAARGPDDIDELLRMVDLADVADVPASELSYGRLSNLALATALATRLPKLLMLDEPAAGLSSVERGQLRQQLLDLRDRGLTIIVVDHDMSFLLPMCDRVVVLDAGAKIADAPPLEVQRDPRVVAAYLGERFAERSKSRLGTVG